VVPSERLVVVRLSVTQDWPRFDMEGISHLVADAIAALPKRTHIDALHRRTQDAAHK
jgi:hypothetical protein